MLNDSVKQTILEQLIATYRNVNPEISVEQIRKRIDIFDMVLSIKKENLENYKFSEVPNEILRSWENLEKAIPYDFSNIKFIEPYLRLLCYIVNPTVFEKKDIAQALLMKLYKTLDVLNVNNYERTEKEKYYDILAVKDSKGLPLEYNDPRHPENVLKDDVERLPFVKAYCARNSNAHFQDTPEEWEHLKCMYYTMLEVAYKNRNKIIEEYTKNSFNYKSYIKKIINSYEEKMNNNFKYIPLSVEIFANDMYDNLCLHYENQEVVPFNRINSELNNGYINLANGLYNKVKLIGYAGVGKSTTLENIRYLEACEFKKNKHKGKIPVIINLIQVQNFKNDIILKLIAQELNIDSYAIVNNMIKNNEISLYIDGINEIRIQDRHEKMQFLDELEHFVVSNKKLKVIAIDRDSNELSILNDLPTFILNKMSDENIKDFIFGNSNSPERVYQKIQESVQNNIALQDTIRNPFMLKSLISIVECNKNIPDNEDEIAESFLKAIVDRERVQKRNYLAPYILRILIYLVAVDVKEKDYDIDGNLTLSYYKMIEIFNEYCDKYKRNDRFDNDEMLDLIVKLGIMKKVNLDLYTFVDDRYYNFFYYSAGELGLL